MINTLDKPTIHANGAQLHKAITKAIDSAIKQVGTLSQDSPSLGAYERYAFSRLFGAKARLKLVRFDSRFLEAAYQFANAISRNTDIRDRVDVLGDYCNLVSLSATALPTVKRGLKLMLVELWRNRVVLLPTVFTPGPYFATQLIDHELLQWVRSFDPSTVTPGGRKSDNHRLCYYGPRLLYATDWRCPEDVSLVEIAALNAQQTLYTKGVAASATAGASQLPFMLFAASLLRDFPGRVNFATSDLERYSRWALDKSDGKVRFEDFKPESNKRVKAPRKVGDKRQGVQNANILSFLSHTQANGDDHASIVRAFQSLQRGRWPSIDWREQLPSYPGREHVDLTLVAPLWIESFKAFLHHRKFEKEYRSEDTTMSCLNLLADYLFFYLPWWKQLYPESLVGLPSSPQMLSRYGFVSRSGEVPVDELPMTLLQALAMRRPNKDSRSVAVHQLSLYFRFVETQFSEREDITGRNFRSPLNDDFDAPRIKKKSKTNKVVIPKQIYGHLLFYCYAVEQFGMHLQQLAVEGKLTPQIGSLQQALRYQCSDFGCIPVVKYRGTEFPLVSVPNVFQWHEREIVDDVSNKSKTVYVPHCTSLRLLITSLETGLRAQSVQWLDRKTWDSLNVNAAPDSYTYALNVNTDKVRVEPWTAYIVYRVRNLLKREQIFQELFADADLYGPVNYENIDTSPFDPIRPLFRSAAGAFPVPDQSYSSVWQWLMVDFEEFYKEKTGETHVRMYRIRPILRPDGTPSVRTTGLADETPYCPLSIAAVHTPHACRATFATNRQGVLELSEIAELIGHQNEVVTAHYTKPSGEDLQARLQVSDAIIVSDYLEFDGSSDGHVRADRPDSVLVRSFAKDRQGTLQRFGFMPPVSLWSTNEAQRENSGLKLLQEGPMSRIRFRETHICPVGEECPGDILEQIGEPRRCGACPLAMKCVEHLSAIAAKRNQLMERMRYLHRRIESLRIAGEPAPVLDQVWDELELDINEWLGWKLSEEILTIMRRESKKDVTEDKMWHVERPEFVRRHLEKVTRKCDATEFLLRRIADSNAYPTLSTPQVQAAAGRLKRKLLAGGNIDDIESWTDDFASVRDTARMLSTMMKATGLTTTQVATQLNAPAHAPVQTILLAGAGSGT